MNEPKELELKYLTDKDFKLVNLISLLVLEGFIPWEIKKCTNTDTYFDTPNKDLLKNGASLRIRTVGKKSIGTLKYPCKEENSFVVRVEIEKELENNSFTSLQKVFQEVPFDLSDVCPIPVITITNNRNEVFLSSEDLTIAVANDDVTYDALDAKEKKTMLEIELKEGTNYEALDYIDKLITSKLGLVSTKESKYNRGLKLTTIHSLTRKKPQ